MIVGETFSGLVNINMSDYSELRYSHEDTPCVYCHFRMQYLIVFTDSTKFDIIGLRSTFKLAFRGLNVKSKLE